MLKITFILLLFILSLYGSVFADSSSCGDPPRIKNGYPVVGNRTHPESNHGAVVTYVCRRNKVLVERGKVQCHFGQWVGDLPECKDTNDAHTGISPAPSSHHNETSSIEGSCGDPPRIENGFPTVGNRTHPGRNHGAVVTYVCRGNKVLVERGKVECHFGQWVGNAPECKDIDHDHRDKSSTTMAPSQTSPRHHGANSIEGNCGDPPRIENGYPIVGNRTHPGRNHGAIVTYHCRDNKVLKEKGKVECYYGQWVGVPPKCIDSFCIKTELAKYIGLKRPLGKFLNSTSFEIECRKGYKPSNPGESITCLNGKWIAPKSICNQVLGLCIRSKLRKYIGLKLPVGNFLNSTSFEIKCRNGYMPSNPGENITCLNGKWMVPKTICIEDLERDDLIGESSVARAVETGLRKRKNKKKNKSRNNSAKNGTSTAEIP